MTEARQCCSLSKESTFCDFRDFRVTKKVIVDVDVIVERWLSLTLTLSFKKVKVKVNVNVEKC